MDFPTHYVYPDQAAEFELYNFHSPQQVSDAVDLLISAKSRIFQLFGEKGSGRDYLLRAAAHLASKEGKWVRVETLESDGLEPDRPLCSLLTYLSTRASGVWANRFSELAKRTKVDLKITGLNFLIASIGIKTDLSIEELSSFFEAKDHPRAQPISEPVRLRNFISAIGRSRKILLHLRNAVAFDSLFISRLVDEARLNPGLFLALSYRADDKVLRIDEAAKFQISAWTRDNMLQTFNTAHDMAQQDAAGGRYLPSLGFVPNKLPADFLDFAYAMSIPQTSRGAFASILLRSVKGGWLSTDNRDVWHVDRHWKKDQSLVSEFEQDAYDPHLAIEARLSDSDIEAGHYRTIREFRTAAAICDPIIPVRTLLNALEVPEDAADGWIDQVDDIFQTDDQAGVLLDLGYQNPGLPKGELVYRFRNPMLPAAILLRDPRSTETARRILNSVRQRFSQSRTGVELLLRVAESAGAARDVEKCQSQLSWWISIEESEALIDLVAADMETGDVSPDLVWEVVRQSKSAWPSTLRLSLVKAYSTRPDGIPHGILFEYFTTLSRLQYEAGHYQAALDAAEEVLRWPMPQPEWRSKIFQLNLAGLSELALGRLQAANVHQTAALDLAHQHLPNDDTDMLVMMGNLALTLSAQGDEAGARALKEQVLAARRLLGEEHPDTLTAMSNLASSLSAQGDAAGARVLQERVLVTSRRLLGAEHPDTLSAMGNLASTLSAQGDEAGARDLREQVLAASRRLLGEEHPTTLTAMSNLALTLSAQGDKVGAQVLKEQVLAARRRLLGEEHPDTLRAMNNLAESLRAQGDAAGARVLQERVLVTSRRLLGAEHPDTLSAMGNLASTLSAQGDEAGARVLEEQVLAARRRVLGEEHPDTLMAMNNLASTLWAQGDEEAARVLQEQMLAASQRLLGEEHPTTLKAMNNLALMVRAEDDEANAANAAGK